MSELMGDTGIHSKELVPVTGIQKVQNIDEFPNEILDRVFRFLDQESLRQTRLVCTKWEDVAINRMSKTVGRLELCFVMDAGINAKGLEDIKKLQSILHSSKHPGMFFTKVSLESPVHNARNGVLIREMSLLNLFQNFGSTLKCLKLYGITLHLSLFRPLIEKWCVNLEELSLVYVTCTEEDGVNIHDFETPPTPLKLNLKKFSFRGDRYQEAEQNLILSTIKNSPKLRVLKAEIPPGEPDLWKKMQNLHHVTKNLEELKIALFDAEDISLISDISLSDKLSSLTLDIFKPLFPKEQLITFLKTVGESLEKLCLRVNIFYYPDEDRDPWTIELPLMKKLKVLKQTTTLQQICFDPMDLLQKLPSLEMLGFEEFEGDNVDAWFGNCSSLTRRPHTTLNTLDVRGSPNRSETIVVINRMFPNLRELSLLLYEREVPEETRESWLISVFQGLSEMKNLKTLSIKFFVWFRVNSGVNFKACFSPLEASQSLENLKMSGDIDTSYSPIYFPPGLEKIFAKIPKLKVVTLEDLRIKKLCDARNLFKTLDEKGVLINLLQNAD